MNFIKKKLKTHKKDEEEEEEYEKAVCEQSLHPGEPKMKNTEEWQFFQQLSMKVQDTVQKTQTTLNKLKDIRQDSLTGKDEKDFFDIGNVTAAQDFSTDTLPAFESSKVSVAPPRPPPPSSGRPVSSDSSFETEYGTNSPAKGPPRPPPPVPSDKDTAGDMLSDSSQQHQHYAPVRPPPPAPCKVSEDLGFGDVKQPQEEPFSLLDEFGFHTEARDASDVPSKSDFQDLLFLDVKDEADPFDTSFVDVSTILPCNELQADRELVGMSNPFVKPKSSVEGKDEKIKADSSKKCITNPFFSVQEKGNNAEGLCATNSSLSHNPFSEGDLSPSTEAFTGEGLLIEDILLPEKTDFSGDSVDKIQPLVSSLQKSGEQTSAAVSLSCNALNLDDMLCGASIAVVPAESDKLKTDSCNELIHTWPDDDLSSNTDDVKPHESEITEKSALPDELGDLLSEVMKVPLAESQPEISHSTDAEKTVRNNVAPTSDAVDVLKLFESEPPDEKSFSFTVGHSSYDSTADSMSYQTPESKVDALLANEQPKSDGDSKDECSKECVESNLVDETCNAVAPVEKVISPCASVPLVFSDIEITSDEFVSDRKEFEFQKSCQDDVDHEFDAFSAKFESVKANSQNESYDPFATGKHPTLKEISETCHGFDSMDEFDPFKVTKVTEQETSSLVKKDVSKDSFEEYSNEADFSVVIKPKVKDEDSSKQFIAEPPKLLPPPKTPTKAFDSASPRFNPFDKDSQSNQQLDALESEAAVEVESATEEEVVPALGEASVRKSESAETPLSPLFDEDTSFPLEEFPSSFTGEGWEMVLRQPNKKKLTGNRFWKKIFVKLSENSVLQLFNKKEDKVPFQELPLQACYSLSEIGAQQYDQYGKIFTVKLQYKFYRERVGVRPGQISKVTQGQITSMGDVAKLGLPLQHAPQTSQMLKLGTHSYIDMKFFIQEIEDALFRMVIHRDRVLTYKTEEVQVIAQDEFYVEQNKTGHVEKQLARVRIFFLAFITGMPTVEVGLNDINRQGKEVVGRYDIIPVVTEEWIRLEDCEFHSCVMQDEFKKSRIIKFIPPDACLFELLRFRIRPPRNRELPLQVRVFMTVTSSRVEIRSDILVPGYSSRKQGQIPCENIQIRFPIPECWIYLFRTEKHFRYGSKKSAARRPGKIKGLERIIGAAQNLDPSLIEVSAGQAKYEHVFHAVVWRIPRLPKEGQGAYTQQLFLLRTELTAFDQIPETFEQYVDVEFTMPATYVSHTTVRSVSVSNPSPPEKYVRYSSKHEYKVEIDFKSPEDIDGLMTANLTAPTASATTVQESTEDEKEDEEEDSD